MASAVSICNLALSYVGDSASVASIDPPDGTAQAQMCATMYPMAVAGLVEQFDWSFAMKRQALVEYTGEDTYQWKAAYALPSDCMRMIHVRSANTQHFEHWFRSQDEPFEILNTAAGRRLYTDADSPIATYITSNINPSLFSPTFVIALAWYLAGMLAGQRIKGQEGYKLTQTCQQQFDKALRVAKAEDGKQQNRCTGKLPRWILARGGRYGLEGCPIRFHKW